MSTASSPPAEPEEPAATAAGPQTASAAQQGWYLAGIGSWFASFGIQGVVFPWIVAFILVETPVRIGLAQAALWLPLLVFLLLGGAVADRLDPRRILLVLHLVALLPPAAVMALELSGALFYWPIIAYGLAMGTIMAFMQPARDGLLSRVSGGRIQRMVTMAIGFQFGTQLCGTLAASLVGIVGLLPVLGIQVLVLAAGAVAALMLLPAPPPAEAREPALRAIGQGLKLVWNHPTIRTVVGMGAFTGFFNVGIFLAVLPVLVRSSYGEGGQFALFYACWAAGNVTAILGLLRLGAREYPGRVLLAAMSVSSLSMLAASFSPPMAAMYVIMALWGAGAGISASMNRTIVQQLAPAAQRARVLSTFQLGFMGSVPLGAFGFGLLVEFVGPGPAMWASPLCFLPVAALVLRGGRIWPYRPEAER